MNDITSVELFNQYKQSVYELADKLPQWNSEDKNRVLDSAISSLFEEAGEIAGIISKKRIRKDYWNAEEKQLYDYKEIRQKFIDETSDFLWVFVCSCHCLGYDSIPNLEHFNDVRKEYEESTTTNFNHILFDLICDITAFHIQASYADGFAIVSTLHDIAYTFGLFLAALEDKYDITFDVLIKYNLSKLNVRYDSTTGKRLDGKE